ncbi:MAG: zonular occludens toxin domain-containing protein, partial [Sulfuricellaceae bacterium]
MSIKIHHGAPGSYKTSGAVMDDFIPCVRSGRVVVTNVRGLTVERVRDAVYPVRFIDRLLRRNLDPVPVFPDIPESFDIIHLDTTTKADRDRLATWFHWAPPGCFFLIDEAQSVFSPRWTAKDIAALDFPGGHDAAAAAGRPATWN